MSCLIGHANLPPPYNSIFTGCCAGAYVPVRHRPSTCGTWHDPGYSWQHAADRLFEYAFRMFVIIRSRELPAGRRIARVARYSFCLFFLCRSGRFYRRSPPRQNRPCPCGVCYSALFLPRRMVAISVARRPRIWPSASKKIPLAINIFAFGI